MHVLICADETQYLVLLTCQRLITCACAADPVSTTSDGMSSSSSSSSTDEEADEAATAAGSTPRCMGSAQHATPSAASAQTGTWSALQLLPPLQSASILPRFVRCQCPFQPTATHLMQCTGSPLRSAAPGAKVPVTISLTAHSSDWDADSYVSSHPPQLIPSDQPGVATPVASAAGDSSARQSVSAGGSGGSSHAQAQGGAGACSGVVTLAAKERKGADKTVRVTSLRAQDIPGSFAAYDVVLQEQVRRGCDPWHCQ